MKLMKCSALGSHRTKPQSASPSARILIVVDDLLFYRGGELSQALESQANKMRQAVAAEPEESLNQADIDEWAAALAHHFAVACPELKHDEVSREPPTDVKLDVSRD